MPGKINTREIIDDLIVELKSELEPYIERWGKGAYIGPGVSFAIYSGQNWLSVYIPTHGLNEYRWHFNLVDDNEIAISELPIEAPLDQVVAHIDKLIMSILAK